MEFDFTPVSVGNPQALHEQAHEAAALYAAMKPTIVTAIARDGIVANSHAHNGERVHTVGTAIERLDDAMPNLINAILMFADDPSVGGQANILKYRQQDGYRQAAGHLIDNAAREFTDPQTKEQLKALDVRLHEIFHQVQSARREAVGPHSAAIVAEDRSSALKR